MTETNSLGAGAIEQWLRKKYVIRRNRGIDYMEAALDDLAREFERYIRSIPFTEDAVERAIDTYFSMVGRSGKDAVDDNTAMRAALTAAFNPDAPT